MNLQFNKSFKAFCVLNFILYIAYWNSNKADRRYFLKVFKMKEEYFV